MEVVSTISSSKTSNEEAMEVDSPKKDVKKDKGLVTPSCSAGKQSRGFELPWYVNVDVFRIIEPLKNMAHPW